MTFREHTVWPSVVALVLVGCLGDSASSDSSVGFDGIAAAGPSGSAGISMDGLVAAYDLSTFSEGLLLDLSVNALDGRTRIRNSTPGVFGDAQLFELVDHRIALPATPAFDLDGPLTIAAWVRVDQLGLHQHIVACDDKWALWVTPADQYRLGDTRGGGWSTAEGSVAPGVWTAVVAVLSGTAGDPLAPETVALYVNGERAGAAHLRTDEARELGIWNPGELYGSDACYIGFESHQGNEAHQEMPFVGAVDELLVYARAWSEDEVAAFSTPSSESP
ncbi:MAG: LamG domain-containing protein [Gemmatimonadota bacterium]|nr:LamG domain-containing protein [Gemmatimonadota bacterium]